MTERPTVGLALIARNEANNLPRLLASVEGAFDQVVLVDTGSTDDTVATFETWAKAQAEPFTWQVGHFTWRDDFAAAREFADSLITTDWKAWADCDDTITGAEHLRNLAAKAPGQIVAYICGYNYAQTDDGTCLCYLKRERFVRTGTSRWEGRVHEAQHFPNGGGTQEVDPRIVEWVHHKGEGQGPDSNDRNLKILRAWVKDEPANSRVLGYLGTENLVRGRVKQAIRWYRRYLKNNPGWDEERAQIHRKLSIALIAEGDIDGAARSAHQALDVMPLWPDSYLTLAEIAYERQEFDKAAMWAQRVLELGHPQTMLIVNPLDYTFQPRLYIAGALGAMERIDEAIEVAGQALAILPLHDLRGHYDHWRAISKREATANQIVGLAKLLIRHGEAVKALALVEGGVPYYAIDHPKVVALRSLLREDLAKPPAAVELDEPAILAALAEPEPVVEEQAA